MIGMDGRAQLDGWHGDLDDLRHELARVEHDAAVARFRFLAGRAVYRARIISGDRSYDLIDASRQISRHGLNNGICEATRNMYWTLYLHHLAKGGAE